MVRRAAPAAATAPEGKHRGAPAVAHAPATLVDDGNQTGQQVTIVSSWLLFHQFGNHTETLLPPRLPLLVAALRDALADTLLVCRSSVGISDLRAVNFGDDVPEVSRRHRRGPQHTRPLVVRAGGGSGGDSRGDSNEILGSGAFNVTQVRASFEVRIFTEMALSGEEVQLRVDGLQSYSRFFELSRVLRHTFAGEQALEGGMVLDDVGLSSKMHVSRAAIEQRDLSECREEGALRHAREAHELVSALCVLLAVLVACAGSTVFAVKYSYTVPHRWNPLTAPTLRLRPA